MFNFFYQFKIVTGAEETYNDSSAWVLRKLSDNIVEIVLSWTDIRLTSC